MSRKDSREWAAVTVVGRDRPGIVAGVSRVLYQHGCNIEELSQTVIRGQFAMVLIASGADAGALQDLKGGLADLSADLDLDIGLRPLEPKDMTPFEGGQTDPFILTVRGEDRPGLAYGITEVLAERGINITNLGARVAVLGDRPEYIQVFEVAIPKRLDHGLVQENLRRRGKEMGVSVDLQHQDIFRAINQI